MSITGLNTSDRTSSTKPATGSGSGPGRVTTDSQRDVGDAKEWASPNQETVSYESEGDVGPEMWKKSACCGGQREEIVQIDVFGETVGLIALNQTFEQLRALGRPPDASVRDELLKMVAAQNYIPASCEDEYRTALVREYARFCAQKEKPRK